MRSYRRSPAHVLRVALETIGSELEAANSEGSVNAEELYTRLREKHAAGRQSPY